MSWSEPRACSFMPFPPRAHTNPYGGRPEESKVSYKRHPKPVILGFPRGICLLLDFTDQMLDSYSITPPQHLEGLEYADRD